MFKKSFIDFIESLNDSQLEFIYALIYKYLYHPHRFGNDLNKLLEKIEELDTMLSIYLHKSK